MGYPFYIQHDQMDCGPTCLRIIAKYYGKKMSQERIKKMTEIGRDGSSFKSLSDAAERLGFRTLGVQVNYAQLSDEVLLPCIAHWGGIHFVVVYKVTRDTVLLADPAYGLIKYKKSDFLKSWTGASTKEGEAPSGALLLLDPTPEFEKQDQGDDPQDVNGFSFLFRYIDRYKKFFLQLVLGLLAGSALQLLFPLVTQSIVDIGIQNNDMNFIYLMLFAQLFLFLGRISIEVIRSWILIHISARINISLVSDFFIKIMRLPISYFDVKMTGDLLQRIGDHRRIEKLLTSSSLNVLFSFINLILFSIILLLYSLDIFLIFSLGSAIYFFWIFSFLKKRKELDYKRFYRTSSEQSKVIELINGMQDIKLNNAERQKRWEWELIQGQLFKLDLKSHSLEQIQSTGANIINELKNILILFVAAKLVLSGSITLGIMLSISYIIGQLNAPLIQIIEFLISTQDAKIALERMIEIHQKENEESFEVMNTVTADSGDITLENVSYRYSGMDHTVINNLNLKISSNQVTAIVGASGSGKTTLLKLLLQFYKLNAGEIKIGKVNLNMISPSSWRSTCGVVMQEGFIFNDTVLRNICVDGSIDMSRFSQAIEIANIGSFIENLPNGYQTKIGQEGIGLSTGQKQRILIARAVYKNPSFILFDEATSALDSTNERMIMDKLDNFFAGKTVVVIAHRLSTVRKANKIVVLDTGSIIEEGTHEELLALKGTYHRLVINQLEMDA